VDGINSTASAGSSESLPNVSDKTPIGAAPVSLLDVAELGGGGVGSAEKKSAGVAPWATTTTGAGPWVAIGRAGGSPARFGPGTCARGSAVMVGGGVCSSAGPLASGGGVLARSGGVLTIGGGVGMFAAGSDKADFHLPSGGRGGGCARSA
jgi:hypothetical protein